MVKQSIIKKTGLQPTVHRMDLHDSAKIYKEDEEPKEKSNPKELNRKF